MSFRPLLASVGRSIPCARRLCDRGIVVDWLWHATRSSPERSSANLIIVGVFPDPPCNDLLHICAASSHSSMASTYRSFRQPRDAERRRYNAPPTALAAGSTAEPVLRGEL